MQKILFEPGARWGLLVCVGLLLGGCFGYDPTGPVPEAKKSQMTPLWSDADVDRVVSVSYESAAPIHQIDDASLPEQCRTVKFLRFKTRTSSHNAAEADAAVLLVPGVLEGANAFEYIGRQLVYMAKTQRNKDIEIWAMDRRSNCLEDLTGFQAAEHAATAGEAEDLILGYYYEGLEVNGKRFPGFLKSKDMPFLLEFGMQQSTEDMYAILQQMIPDPALSKQKVFVGGHSLGGAHSSMFLAWDLDGDPATTQDQGANLVAGAIGFDTSIGSVLDGLPGMSSTVAMVDVASIEKQAVAESIAEGETDDDAAYKRMIGWMRNGILPKNVDIPLLFSAEAIALPEAVGILASKGPDQESTIIARVPKSPVISNLFRFFHTRNGPNYTFGPHIEQFRYTNEAMVGLMFDDHFSILAFLQTSLGHLHGGAVVPKSPLISFARNLPVLKDIVNMASGPLQQHIAADAGPDFKHLGQGPLYSWAKMDEIGSPDDLVYTDETGEYEYTRVEEEMVRLEDFARALYIGPTNLTEWYFPLRILIDASAGGTGYAPEYGINTLNPDSFRKIPTLLLLAKGGLSEAFAQSNSDNRLLEVVWLEGQAHLDPMFATANLPQLHDNQVENNLLDFIFSNTR
ncbi:MAG: hypothetical protein WBA20_09465 [Ketobacter sp.]